MKAWRIAEAGFEHLTMYKGLACAMIPKLQEEHGLQELSGCAKPSSILFLEERLEAKFL